MEMHGDPAPVHLNLVEQPQVGDRSANLGVGNAAGRLSNGVEVDRHFSTFPATPLLDSGGSARLRWDSSSSWISFSFTSVSIP